MTVQSLTIDQLVVSEFNVRQNQEDANATTALEDSIAAVGLYLPLVIHPLAPAPAAIGAGKRRTARPAHPEPVERGKWGVLDGGRRCRAIRKLVDAGRLPADWPIDCVVRDVDPARITELSLGAFLLTRDLREYEISAAVSRMLDQGMDPAEIARNLGQQPEWVARQLRLGHLAPEIFAAHAAGDISIDEARAYAATADQDLQRAAWTHFQDEPAFYNRPDHIRAWLKVGDRELARLLAFVGEDDYRKAGGAYELDLFAGDSAQRGRVADEGLLRGLAETRLALVRQDLRRRSGRTDLRFITEPPKIQGYTDHSLELQPQTLPGEPEPTIVLPRGEIVARLEIREDGQPHATWWWESRKAQTEARKTARRDGDHKAAAATLPGGPVAADAGFTPTLNFTAAQQARAAVREEHGLSADGLHVVRSLRRELLRALLVTEVTDGGGDGTLGRDYVIWSQLRQALRLSDKPHITGARGLASAWSGTDDNEPRDIVRPHLEQAEAHAVWERALGRIKGEAFITLDDPAEALQAYVGAAESLKDLAGAVLAGIALLRSANVPGWRIPAHDRLAALAGGDDDEQLRAFWIPTDDFVGLFPKLRRLELAQPFEQPLKLKALAAGKDGEATRAATQILARRCWVHPLLRFGAAAPQSQPVPA